jgi:hypothetical protein
MFIYKNSVLLCSHYVSFHLSWWLVSLTLRREISDSKRRKKKKKECSKPRPAGGERSSAVTGRVDAASQTSDDSQNAGKAGAASSIDLSRFKKSPVKKKAAGEFHIILVIGGETNQFMMLDT